MRSALLDGLDPLVQLDDVVHHRTEPDLLHGPVGGGHAHDANVERVNAHPQRHNEPGQDHNQGAQHPNGITHPASLPPDRGDPVNHPSHYTRGGIETIAVIEAWGLGFHLANVVKYVSRAGHKDPARTVEDLKKARFYLDRKIALLEAEQASDLTGLAAREAL